jgi:hypothetical protein
VEAVDLVVWGLAQVLQDVGQVPQGVVQVLQSAGQPPQTSCPLGHSVPY